MATTFECPCCDKTIRFQRAGAHIDVHKEEFFGSSWNINGLKSSLSRNIPYVELKFEGKSRQVFMKMCLCCNVAYKVDESDKSSSDKTWMLKHVKANPGHLEGHLQRCKELLEEYDQHYNKNVVIADKNEHYEQLLAHKDSEIATLKKELELLKKQAAAGKPVVATKRLDTTTERLRAKDDAIDKFCDALDNHYGHKSHSDYYSYLLRQTNRFHVKQEMSEDSYDQLLEDISDVSYFRSYLPGGENDPALDE